MDGNQIAEVTLGSTPRFLCGAEDATGKAVLLQIIARREPAKEGEASTITFQGLKMDCTYDGGFPFNSQRTQGRTSRGAPAPCQVGRRKCPSGLATRVGRTFGSRIRQLALMSLDVLRGTDEADPALGLILT